jgi:hypothetical protein
MHNIPFFFFPHLASAQSGRADLSLPVRKADELICHSMIAHRNLIVDAHAHTFAGRVMPAVTHTLTLSPAVS